MRRLLLLLALLMACPGLAAGEPGFARLTDTDGVTYYTNAPTDPRYRRIPGMSGTAEGWLNLPGATAGAWADDIREIAGRYGLSPGLVTAVIRVESGFNARAVSSKGARGLMQLMPATASSLGVRNAFDPRQNIEGGVRHLRYLVDRYPGNLPLALAAYNAGEGAVNHHGGIPPYPETQNYVSRILHIHREPADGADPARVVYRYESADGTLTYTNVRPPAQPRLLR